jgi:hypothetical protein
VELLAILIVLVGGFGFLVVRRHWLYKRDAELSEGAGAGWRFRSELPRDAGPPYSDFAADLFLLMPSDVMEGIEEGFETSYFTIEDGGRWRGRIQRSAAIVQLPVETPKFRYVAEDLDGGAPGVLAAIQRHTPPHHDTGTPGRVGPMTAELLSYARSVLVETSPFAVFIRSKGASAEAVSRLTMALAKAIVADAGSTSTLAGSPASTSTTS